MESFPREEAGGTYPAVMRGWEGRMMGIICNMKAHNPRADDLKGYAVSTLNK